MTHLLMTGHGYCLLWDGPLVSAHVLSDAGIALAYFSIPAVLLAVRRRVGWQVPRTLFLLFSIFILSCGMTHVMDIVVMWHPWYWTQAVVKALTAGSSLVTAGYLFRLIGIGWRPEKKGNVA